MISSDSERQYRVFLKYLKVFKTIVLRFQMISNDVTVFPNDFEGAFGQKGQEFLLSPKPNRGYNTYTYRERERERTRERERKRYVDICIYGITSRTHRPLFADWIREMTEKNEHQSRRVSRHSKKQLSGRIQWDSH